MALAGPSLNMLARCPATHRSAVMARAVAAPTRPTTKSAVPELLDGRQTDHSLNFQEYTQATQMLNRLKGQASDLEVLLDQLNALEASLDESVLAPPVRDDPGERAERQAKRAAKRAERRAQATSASVSGTSASVDSLMHSQSSHHAALDGPSTSSSHVVPSSENGFKSSTAPSSPSTASSASDVQHLEELFKLTVGEPHLLKAPAATSVLRPRKLVPKRAATAAAAAAAAPPLAPSAPSASRPIKAASVTAPSPAADSLSKQLERLLGPHSSPSSEQDEELELDGHMGPSEDDLLALEREVDALEMPLADDEEDQLRGHSALEASALVLRTPGQLSVMPAGPSLLSLIPATAAPGRSARVRATRRAARNGNSGRTGRLVSDVDGRGHKAAGKDGTNQFMHQSSTVAVLDVDTEREVTEVCRDFLFLEKVKRQCQKTLHRKATTDEVAAAVGMEVEGFKLRYHAGLKAKELLLKSNYKLVMTVCKKYIGKGAQLQDLVSEGVKGLLKGVEKYDASKGFRFGTYAHWWIRQAISRSLAETGRAVRLPVHMIEQLTKLKNVTAQLQAELNREPTLEELSAGVGLPVVRIQVLLEAARSASSLETPMGGTELGPTIKDSVEDERAAADEEFGSSSLKDDMEAMLSDLSGREARVVRLRFGLEDGKEWTLEDIGAVLDVTRERIRQIEAKALRKLKIRTIDVSGKLKEYSDNMDMLDGKEVAARTSSGTRKT